MISFIPHNKSANHVNKSQFFRNLFRRSQN